MDEYEQTYSAEGDSGVEVSSKKGWLYLLLFLVVLFISGIVYLSNSFAQQQNITKITLTGNEIVSSADLIKNINLNEYNSKQKSNLLNQLKSRVEKNPYVEFAYIYQKNSSEIIVEVHEKQPTAIIIDDDGNNSFAANDGTVLPNYSKFTELDFPIIRGIDVTKSNCRKILKSAIHLLSGIKSGSPYDLSKSISEIIYNKNENNFRVSLSESGKEILIGNSVDIEDKSEKLIVLLRNIEQEQDLADAESIDLRWKNQIVVKRKFVQVLPPDSLTKKI